MNHDTARVQVLSSHLSNAMNEAIGSQTELVILRQRAAELADAAAKAEKWEHACRNLLRPEDFERVKAQAELPDA